MSLSRRILILLRLIRYRFLVVAGLFPYLMGSAAALPATETWQPGLFLLGLLGIASALVAVELFNEYFDALSGNDFVFSLAQRKPLARWMLWTGLGALLLSLAAGLLLSLLRDWWIMAFAAMGAVGVVFYVGPPLRLAYRGLGELVIAACYGPLMILGAFYLQAGRITGPAMLLSVPPALLILALVIANEIPDYYQDMLVAKKNLVVRFGRSNAARFFACLLALFYISLAVGILLHAVPMLCLILLLTLPVAFRMCIRTVRNSHTPQAIVPVIRDMILLFLATLTTMGIGYIVAP